MRESIIGPNTRWSIFHETMHTMNTVPGRGTISCCWLRTSAERLKSDWDWTVCYAQKGNWVGRKGSHVPEIEAPGKKDDFGRFVCEFWIWNVSCLEWKKKLQLLWIAIHPRVVLLCFCVCCKGLVTKMGLKCASEAWETVLFLKLSYFYSNIGFLLPDSSPKCSCKASFSVNKSSFEQQQQPTHTLLSRLNY